MKLSILNLLPRQTCNQSIKLRRAALRYFPCDPRALLPAPAYPRFVRRFPRVTPNETEMNIRELVEDRLRTAGFPLDQISRIHEIRPTVVLTVGYTTAREIAVTHLPPCDTAVCFEGLHFPFEGVTLLIEQAVASDWGLFTPRPDPNEPANT